MPSSPPKVAFVLNGKEHFEHFHETLCTTLERLHLKLEIVTTWSQAKKIFETQRPNYDLFFIDLGMDGFNANELKTWMDQPKKEQHPPVIAIHFLPDYEESVADKILEIQATVAKSYSMQEIAFVINRFIVPGIENKRKFPRALATVNVEVKNSGGAKNLREETFVLGSGGAFIKCYNPLPIQEDVEILLYLPDGQSPLACRATVRYSRPYSMGQESLFPPGMGIQFYEMDSDCRSRIEGYVNHRLMVTEPKRNNGNGKK